MQICVYDLFDINFSNYTCYDTISTYVTLILSLSLSLSLNLLPRQDFCGAMMHDTG